MNPSEEYMHKQREHHGEKLALMREYARGYRDGRRSVQCEEPRVEHDRHGSTEQVLRDYALSNITIGEAIDEIDRPIRESVARIRAAVDVIRTEAGRLGSLCG